MERRYITTRRPRSTRRRCTEMEFLLRMWRVSPSILDRSMWREHGLSELQSGSETRKLYVWSMLLFFACTLIKNCCYAIEDAEYSKYEKGLLANPCLPPAQFKQNEMYADDHLFDSSQVFLVATEKIGVPEELYVYCHKTEFASSVQLEYTCKHSLSIEETLRDQSSVSSESIGCCV